MSQNDYEDLAVEGPANSTTDAEVTQADEPAADLRKGDGKDPVIKRIRDVGKSLLPIARVQRIIKADKVR